MTDVDTADMPHEAPDQPRTARRTAGRLALVVGLVAFVTFWTWALFFASKEAINRVDDRAWAERAEQICQSANRERLALADFREMSDPTPELVRERAAIVDRATDVVERMLDDIVAEPPSDAKGRALVPLWETDYRTYISDRRAFTDDLAFDRRERAVLRDRGLWHPDQREARNLRRRQRDARLRAAADLTR